MALIEAAVLLVALAVVKYAKMDKGVERALGLIASSAAFMIAAAATSMAVAVTVVDMTALAPLIDVFMALAFITGLIGGLWAAIKWVMG